MSVSGISIVMPVFNEPVAMLDEAVQSILGQTFTDWELLLVDDGSTDAATLTALKNYREGDARIRIINKPNGGQTSALLLGIKNASSDIIARQDADDISQPDRLLKQWEMLHAYPGCALVGCIYQYISESGIKMHAAQLPLESVAIRAAFPCFNPFGHGSVVFRKKAYEEIGGYRAFFRHCQDYDLFWRIAEKHEVRNIPDVGYLYRLRKGSQSHAKQGAFFYEVEVARILALQRIRGAENLAEAVAQAETKCSTWDARRRINILNGDQLLLSGSYRNAMRCFMIGAGMGSMTAILKLLRCIAWMLLPGSRKNMFRVRRPINS
jgi:glycosyltransferase involved in cell wall biosynthesis